MGTSLYRVEWYTDVQASDHDEAAEKARAAQKGDASLSVREIVVHGDGTFGGLCNPRKVPMKAATVDDLIALLGDADVEALKKVIGAAFKRLDVVKPPARCSCSSCGSTDIETESWVPVNGPAVVVPDFGEVALLSSSSEGTVYCNECSEHNKWWCEINPETGECANHDESERGEPCPKPHA